MLRIIIKMLKGNKDPQSQKWNAISEIEKLNSLLSKSEKLPQVIYKHSTRCSVSYLAKEELERHMNTLTEHADMHMINVVEERELSNVVAEKLNIRHESPQVLVLKNRQVIWSGSHWNVKGREVLSRVV